MDANVYWFLEDMFHDESLLEEFLADVPAAYGTKCYLAQTGEKKRIVVEKPAGYPGLDYIEGDYALESILESMDEAGIDKAVMKTPCCQEWMGIAMCSIFNDGMAAYAKKSGGRLIHLAVLPPWGSAAAERELIRCVTALGVHGVQLSAHYGNLYLDDPSFEPLLEKLNELKLTAYIHHTPAPVGCEPIVKYTNLRRTYGRCVDQAIAVSRELFGGVIQRYPNIKFVHSMLGGGFYAFANMFFPAAAGSGRFDPVGSDLRNAFKKSVYFEMSHAQPWGKEQLECAIKALGADHVVFGSSYPVRKEWMQGGPDFINGLEISNEDKALILGENARFLYGID
ncbi:MAG: amidohydrolase family protein [Clostridiales bacterium]|nr:amidohydrolase family protein [Clostridiales bacterium]